MLNCFNSSHFNLLNQTSVESIKKKFVIGEFGDSNAKIARPTSWRPPSRSSMGRSSQHRSTTLQTGTTPTVDQAVDAALITLAAGPIPNMCHLAGEVSTATGLSSDIVKALIVAARAAACNVATLQVESLASDRNLNQSSRIIQMWARAPIMPTPAGSEIYSSASSDAYSSNQSLLSENQRDLEPVRNLPLESSDQIKTSRRSDSLVLLEDGQVLGPDPIDMILDL